MTTNQFNPAEPYTFEDTEEDRLLAFNVLIDYQAITKSFRCFTDVNEDKVWWDENQSYCKQGGGRILVCMSLDGPLSDWPNYKINFPVTYTPPEAIKVIMSGERFEMENRFGIYWLKDGLIESDLDSEMPPKTLSEFLERFQMSWHTAKLVEEKPRVFKDWEELCQWYSQFAPDDKSKMNTYDFELKVFNEKYSTIYEIDSDCKLYGLYRDELIMAFNLGATVELVTPEQSSVVEG